MSEVRFKEKVEQEARNVDTSDDGYCHILDADDKTYCGKVESGSEVGSCLDYNGEAICPSCGRATCPTCAVMSSLNDRLVD